MHEYLVRLGRETVQSLATEAGTGYQGQRVKRGKVVYRFKGNRPKTVHGLYGTVTVQRGQRYTSWGSGTGSAVSTIWRKRAKGRIKGA